MMSYLRIPLTSYCIICWWRHIFVYRWRHAASLLVTSFPTSFRRHNWHFVLSTSLSRVVCSATSPFGRLLGIYINDRCASTVRDTELMSYGVTQSWVPKFVSPYLVFFSFFRTQELVHSFGVVHHWHLWIIRQDAGVRWFVRYSQLVCFVFSTFYQQKLKIRLRLVVMIGE